MKLSKVLFVATCLAIFDSMALSSPTVPSSLRSVGTVGNMEFLVKALIAPRISNATEQMKKFYPFIASSNHLEESPISLGLYLNTDCSTLQMEEKLGAVYKQLGIFMSPLYLAFSYEQAQGPQHANLKSVLEWTSRFLNDTVSYTKHKMLEKRFTVPQYSTIPESKLDEYARVYLNALFQRNLVSVTVTDDVVKRYRNYVTVYMLHDVIIDIRPCITGM